MVWCVSGPGLHGKLQSLVSRCTVRQTTNVAEDGVTTSGYGTEYAWQIRAVGPNLIMEEVTYSMSLTGTRHTTQQKLVKYHNIVT